jgi:hypothetical protein
MKHNSIYMRGNTDCFYNFALFFALFLSKNDNKR